MHPADTARNRLHVGWLVVSSIVGGVVAAVFVVAFLVPGAAEHVILGSSMLAFGAGWALLAVLSIRFTDQPQRWAAVPAAYMITVGTGLLVLSPGYQTMNLAGWVWPAVVFGLAVWMMRRARAHLHSRTRAWVVYPVCVALALSALGGGFSVAREALASDDLPAAGVSLDVGGRLLYMVCSGEGSPVVILQAGLFGSSADWDRIVAGVEGTTRVCAYDRAGRGRSDRAPDPQDGNALATDLHALLDAARVEGPYILVGHSTGGVYVRIFAAQYPGAVAGIVLLDAQPVEAFDRLPAYPSFYRQMKILMGVLPPLARVGIMRVEDAHSLRDEFVQLPNVLDEAASLPDLGDRPLMVLTAEEEALEGWLALQEEMASLSTDSIHRVLPHATHDSLIRDELDATAAIGAIIEVVGAVRDGTPLRSP